MKRERVHSKNAPEAIGPYSQAVCADDLVFVSGQIPFTASGELVGESVEEQTTQVLENIRAILHEAGCDLENVVKATVYLASMEDFAAVNEIYAGYFSGDIKPARACVEVSRLPKGVAVEIDAIAVRHPSKTR